MRKNMSLITKMAHLLNRFSRRKSLSKIFYKWVLLTNTSNIVSLLTLLFRFNFQISNEIIDRFPWRFVVAILLLCSVTAQVMFLITSQGKHYWTHQLVFLNMFYEESDYTENTINRVKHFYDLNEMVEHINETIDNYYSIDDGN